MKQLKRFVLFLSVVIAITGCSQDDFENVTGNDDTGKLHEVEVTFNIGAYVGIRTRAASRPLVSSDNWQRVTNVRIYVFRSETGGSDDQYFYYRPEVRQEDGSTKYQDYFYVKDFAETKETNNKDDVWGNDDDEQENESHTYSIKPLLKEGYYKFLVVGRDDIDETNSSSTIKMTDPNFSKEDYDDDIVKYLMNNRTYSPEDPAWSWEWDDEGDFHTSLKYAYITSLSTGEVNCGEVFSGCSDAVHVTSESKGFLCPVTLKRAVAGFLLYITNVPKKVKATVSLGFTKGKPPRPDLWTIEKDRDYEIEQISICSIRKNKDLVLPTRKILDEYLDYIYHNKEMGEPIVKIERESLEKGGSDDECYTGKYLAGNFAPPQPAYTGNETIKTYVTIPEEEKDTKDGETQARLESTLYLVYFAKGGNVLYPVKWIPIQMNTGERKFSIDANYFYSVGDKNIEKNIDNPIDLRPGSGGGNDIVIEVVPDWDWDGELEWQ